MYNYGYNSRVTTEGILFREKNTSTGGHSEFRVSDYMTCNWFESILYYFKYTNEEAPKYKDSFHEVRHMLCMWNDNTDQYFATVWITCLDDSMTFWSNNFTCPGFMFVPQKPWQFGNKYHTICCGLSGILFGI